MKTIRLYGKLGAKFGRRFNLNVANPAEAIRALCVTVAGFQQFLLESHKDGIAYKVFIGKQPITKDDLHLPSGREEIRIAPVIVGSKRAGIGQLFIGAALFAASWFVGGMAGFAYLGTFSVAGVMGMTGISLMLGGVAQMLAPQQKGLGIQEPADKKTSHVFGGMPNMMAMGQCVPVVYGSPYIKPNIISQGIWAENYAK